jgi:hypothetical protein
MQRLLMMVPAGSVGVDELIESLIPMGANQMEIDQMVKTADADGVHAVPLRFCIQPVVRPFAVVLGDGAVSFKEFLHAYHSNEWFKVYFNNTEYTAVAAASS